MTLSLKKRENMIKAAKKLFLSQGFDQTSMDAITVQADVSKKTLYQHFPNKINLFQEMLLNHWQEIEKDAGDMLSHDKKPKIALKEFGQKFLNFLYHAETQQLFRLLIAESERFPMLTDSLTLKGKAPFTRELIRYLDAQEKLGNLHIKDTALAASHFMGLLKEDQFWPKLLGFTKVIDRKKINKIIDHAVEMFLNYYGNF